LAAGLRFIEVGRDGDKNLYTLKSITWFDADANSPLCGVRAVNRIKVLALGEEPLPL